MTPRVILAVLAILLTVSSFVWPHPFMLPTAVLLLAVAVIVP